MADPALGHYRPWLEDIRKEKPYQLEDRIEQLFHEKSVTGLFGLEPAVRRDHRQPALRGRRQVARHRADAQSAAGSGARNAQGRRRGARHDVQGESAAVHADHQYARQGQGDFRSLARLRRRRRRAPSVQPGRAARSWTRWCRRCARPMPRLSHRYYALKAKLVRQDAAAALGSQRAAAEGGDAHDRLDGGARNGAHRLCGVLTAHGRDRGAFLRAALDRCAGAARQGAGRLRASDGAVGASLCAAQLPGQDARRDDARARARPWRASGAGGAERCADGADAADAGGNRERVRRDADLQERCSPTPPTATSARPCSPARSRT